MTEMPVVDPPIVEPAPAQKSSFERIVGALFAPTDTFRDIARRPNILLPLIIVVVASIFTAVIQAKKIDFAAAVREQMEERAATGGPKMSAEQMERTERFVSIFGKAATYASPFLSMLILAIIAMILLVGVRLMGGEGDFKQAYSTVLHAWMPFVILTLLLGIILLTKREVSALALPTLVRSNPAFLVSMKKNPVLFSLLSSLDVFTIWVVALLTIGFAEVGKLSRAKTAAIVVTLWLVIVFFKLGLAGLQALRS